MLVRSRGGIPAGRDRYIHSLSLEWNTFRTSEGGRRFIGLTMTARPWILWDRYAHRLECERCGETRATPETLSTAVPETKATYSLLADWIVPFGQDHKACTRKT